CSRLLAPYTRGSDRARAHSATRLLAARVDRAPAGYRGGCAAALGGRSAMHACADVSCRAVWKSWPKEPPGASTCAAVHRLAGQSPMYLDGPVCIRYGVDD